MRPFITISLIHIAYVYIVLFVLCAIFVAARRINRFNRTHTVDITRKQQILSIFTFTNMTQLFLTILATAAIAYIVLDNLEPFGVTTEYSLSQNLDAISPLEPKTRVTSTTSDGHTIY